MIDQEAMKELYLFIENDEQIYNQRLMPVLKNLLLKIKKGVYLENRAPLLYRYLVDDAARKYCKEYGGNVRNVFNKDTRWALADEMARDYKVELDLGNYDNLLTV